MADKRDKSKRQPPKKEPPQPEPMQEEELRERRRLIGRQGYYVPPSPPEPLRPAPKYPPMPRPKPKNGNSQELNMKSRNSLVYQNDGRNRVSPKGNKLPYDIKAPAKGLNLGDSLRRNSRSDYAPAPDTENTKYDLDQFVPQPYRQMDDMNNPFGPMPENTNPPSRPPQYLEASEDRGFSPMGKAEENKKWKYDNYRSREGKPVEEDAAYIINDLFDYWDSQRPEMGKDGNPTEISMWERNVRRAAKEAGLSDDETEKLLQDLYDLR
jgi:hypothetical protein